MEGGEGGAATGAHGLTATSMFLMLLHGLPCPSQEYRRTCVRSPLQEINSMKARHQISADQYFRELETWARKRREKNRASGREVEGKVIDLMKAKARREAKP